MSKEMSGCGTSRETILKTLKSSSPPIPPTRRAHSTTLPSPLSPTSYLMYNSARIDYNYPWKSDENSTSSPKIINYSASISSSSSWISESLFEGQQKCSVGEFCVNELRVRRQREEISRLRAELARVSCDRDALAIQVQQLNMEILAGELTRLDCNTSFPSGTLCSSKKMGQGQSGCLDSHSLADYEGRGELTLVQEGDEEGESTNLNGCLLDDDEDGEVDVMMISSHLIPQSVDDHLHLSSTYSSSEMTRLSSSSSSSSASSSPVLFTSGPQQTTSAPFIHHDSTEENGETAFVERRYGGVPARDAALVIQRAYRRYSMVKEFQRIKTERRLSRRINNNVVGSNNSPPVNSCDICIDVHPESTQIQHPHHIHGHHHHHPHHQQGLEGLEDDLENSSMLSGELPGPHDLAEVTEVDVEVDQTVLVNSHHHSHHHVGSVPLPPPTGYYGPQHKGHSHHHSHPHGVNNKTSSSRHQQQQQQQQHHQHYHHHQGGGGGSRFPSSSSDNNNVQSSRQFQPHPHQMGQPRNHIPTMVHQSHSQSHLVVTQQGPPQQQQQQNISPQQGLTGNHNNSAPGGLLMVKGQPQQQVMMNGSSSTCTTPLTNVSPNLSSSSMSSGGAAAVVATEESEIIRKRLYRVGLNLFNKKPEAGVAYLVKKKFLEGSAPSVARFLISRKGLSKQMIGEYLTNLQSPFSMSCLEHFVNEIDLCSMPVDLALRRFQNFYRMPGEAQKIERLMESFSRRYGVCNPHVVSQFRNGADSVFVLAFAIIMLNTDLHTPHLKQDRRMKLEDFIKNLRGVDDGGDIDREILAGIYDRIKSTEFKTGSDHVTQVMKVQQTIVGKKPNLAVPHRRLVCYCRLYEVPDMNKKEKAGCHQREVFLFNDLLVLTKIFHKKRNSVTYSFRQSYPLGGLTLHLFSNGYYEHGLSLKRGDAVLLNLNARNEHDRAKFTEDLREAIAESDEMARIETLSKENRDRDSGVDVGKIKRFSNSLLDINDQCKPVRRGSCGSLDSGMSVSFQSDENHAHPPVGSSQGGGVNPLQPSNLGVHGHQGSTCSSSSSSSQNSHK